MVINMKSFFCITILSLCFLIGNAQSEEININVTRKQLRDAKVFSDLVPNVDKNCKIKNCMYGMVVNGNVNEFKLNGHFLALPKDINRLQKVIVREIESDCKNITNKKYVFTVIKDEK